MKINVDKIAKTLQELEYSQLCSDGDDLLTGSIGFDTILYDCINKQHITTHKPIPKLSKEEKQKLRERAKKKRERERARRQKLKERKKRRREKEERRRLRQKSLENKLSSTMSSENKEQSSDITYRNNLTGQPKIYATIAVPRKERTRTKDHTGHDHPIRHSRSKRDHKKHNLELLLALENAS